MKNIFFLASFFLTVLSGFSQERFLRKAKSAIVDNDKSRAVEMVKTYESKEGIRPESYFLRYLINLSFGTTIIELDECWMDLSNAINKYHLVAEKDKKDWCEDFDYCLQRFPYYISLTDSMIFERYKRTNDIDTVSFFIEKYYQSNWKSEARIFKSYLAFEKAFSENSEEKYLEYLKDYSQYPYADSAKVLLWNVAYSNVSETNTIEAFERFLKKYTEAPQVNLVKIKLWDLAWKKTLEKNNKSGYTAFVKEYPEATQVADAKSIIEEIEWKETQTDGTISSYEFFINKYPSSKFNETAETILKQLKQTKFLQDAIENAKDDVAKLHFSHALEMLNNIDSTAPSEYLVTKDSLLSRIAYLKPLVKSTFGRYFVNIKGVEIIMVFGAYGSDSTLFCKLKSFSKGVPINGVESDGSFEFENAGGVLNVTWELENLNSTMSNITVLRNQNKSSLKLVNGTIYKKLSDDYESEIESTVKVAVKPSAPSDAPAKKIVCQSTWKTIRDLEDILKSISDEWESYVEREVRSEYQEFTENIQITGANNRGIYITATGNSTGATFKILWTCNGTVIVYDAIAN
jgi:outer membrane protein assembly factor BamD (BamD/ComL family)